MSSDVHKFVVLFKAVGSTPILKQNKFKVDANQDVASLSNFLRKQLKLGYEGGNNLFLYVNSAFAPAPDESLRNLYKCFSSEGILHGGNKHQNYMNSKFYCAITSDLTILVHPL
ncbi:APG12-domain-containing protein [Rozella allomycis CSF55]|uniref:Ubiquitin-like protein ATG12 n=1 Tax=Rozella allomycis (strain CSF55) TaxID=988480 RepID=A0A4P9YKX5_ROZAC|nr:APG12-domain-containing protein [Rozella allomycis CSF55]